MSSSQPSEAAPPIMEPKAGVNAEPAAVTSTCAGPSIGKIYAVTFFLMAVLLGLLQLLPARPRLHPLFPFITLDDPDLPFFNRPNFKDTVYSWYALDDYIAGELAAGRQPFAGRISAEDYALLMIRAGDRPETTPLRGLFPESEFPGAQTPLLVSIETDARGFRISREDAALPSSDRTLRVVVAEASVAFGANVEATDTWPAQLRRVLQSALPDTRIEVVNGGAISFDSNLGVEAVRRKLLPLKPDWLIVGYSFNDYSFSSRSFLAEAAGKSFRPEQEGKNFLRVMMEEHDAYRLSWKRKARDLRFSQLVRDAMAGLRGPPPIVNQKMSFASMKPYLEGLRGRHNTPDDVYLENLRTIAKDARAAGAKVLFLNTNLGSPYNLPALEAVAEEFETSLVDVRSVFAEETGLTNEMGIRSMEPVSFRVEVPQAVRQKLPSGFHVYAFGDFFSAVEIGLLELLDDGNGPDEVAGDGIYSATLPLLHGTILSFRFGLYEPPAGSAAGSEDYWKGTLHQEFEHWRIYRRFEVFNRNRRNPRNPRLGSVMATPVYRFEDLTDRSDRDFTFQPYMAEICHPNVLGYRRMAEAIGKAILAAP